MRNSVSEALPPTEGRERRKKALAPRGLLLAVLIRCVTPVEVAHSQAPVDADPVDGEPVVTEPMEPEAIDTEPVGAALVEPEPAPAEPVTAAPVESVPPPPASEVEEAEEDSRVPEGEEELMADHPVEPSAIRFVPGKGLELTSADHRFRTQIRVRVQPQWEVTGAAGMGDMEWGQQVRLRRARLQLGGYMFSESVRYKMELAVSPNDMGISNSLDDDGRIPRHSPLLDFYIDFRPLRDLEIRVGQYKIPSNRQRVISSGNLQLVDRSIFNSEFTLDRDVGFDLRSRDLFGLDVLRYYLGLYMGRGRGARGNDDFGMMYLSRIEVLPLGSFKDYSESDFQRGGPRLSIGLGYTFIDRARRNRGILGSTPADGGTTDTHHVFGDVMFKWAGFSFIGEAGYRRGNRNPGDAVDNMGVPMPVEDPRDGVGVNLQAGFLIPRQPLELAARFAFVRGTGGSTSLGDGNELTVGFSYYPGRHPYKVQLDYSRLWASDIDAGDHCIRLQLQVSL